MIRSLISAFWVVVDTGLLQRGGSSSISMLTSSADCCRNSSYSSSVGRLTASGFDPVPKKSYAGHSAEQSGCGFCAHACRKIAPFRFHKLDFVVPFQHPLVTQV